MKKIVILLALIILTGGCYKIIPWAYSDKYKAEMEAEEKAHPSFQTRLDRFIARGNQLDSQLYSIKVRSQDISERQISFMQKLNDQQLIIFESALQAFKSNDLAAQEIAKRNLRNNLDDIKYSMAIQLLNDKAQLEKDNADLGIEWARLREEYATFKRQIERQQDREAMQNLFGY